MTHLIGFKLSVVVVEFLPRSTLALPVIVVQQKQKKRQLCITSLYYVNEFVILKMTKIRNLKIRCAWSEIKKKNRHTYWGDRLTVHSYTSAYVCVCVCVCVQAHQSWLTHSFKAVKNTSICNKVKYSFSVNL